MAKVYILMNRLHIKRNDVSDVMDHCLVLSIYIYYIFISAEHPDSVCAAGAADTGLHLGHGIVVMAWRL